MACEICSYYNYKYDEVIKLDFDVFETLYDGMTQLKARDTIRDFTKHDWSNMKSQDRNKMHRKLYKIAYPLEFKESAVTTDKLKGIGIITPQTAKNGR